jgi:hypothetical protein
MFIYFRACEKQQTISNVTRFGNFDKTIILKKCWLSIQKNIKNTDKVFVIHDEVSETTLEWMRSTSNTSTVFILVPSHDWSFHQHTVTLIDVLRNQCSLYPKELHYIVEDDYLHTEDALEVLRSTLSEWGGFAVPYDYPDRYLNPEPSYIVIGADRHWRTITSSTMTVLAKGFVWSSVIGELEKAAPTSNDKVFDSIYAKIKCLSPLPGLSTHLTDRHHTPFIDWKKVWDSYET